MSQTQHRVLSGIRATGQLHLGNYLGAVKGMLALQDDPTYETFYMVADAHAITTPYQVGQLRHNRRSVIIDYLALGLDPEKSTLFLQSDISAHFELAFYLSSVITVAKMRHLPTFKDKVKQYPKQVNMALLNYPVLMAADILLYKANLVPVGIDQEPHLEVAREVARKCNQTYGMDFPEPQRFKTAGQYVPSLLGDGKMSKSVAGSYINLTDDLATIEAKLAKVPTDAGRGQIKQTKKNGRSESSYFIADQESKGVKVLLTLVELFMGQAQRQDYELAYQAEGLSYKDLKHDLAQAIFQELAPIQKRRQELVERQAYIDQVISTGQQKAQSVANTTLAELKSKLGLA